MTRSNPTAYTPPQIERDPSMPLEVLEAGTKYYHARIDKAEADGEIPDERLYAELGWCAYQIAKREL